MEAGKTYVTILPGRKRPAFVRKRRDPFDTPSGISQSSIIIRPRARSVDRSRQVHVHSEPKVKYIMGPLPPPGPPAPLTMLPPQWVTSSQPLELAPPPLLAPQTHYIAAHEHAYPSIYTQNTSMACPIANSSLTQAVEHHPQTSETITAEVVTPNIKDGVIQKHKCSACGKFRSPSYHARHPLATGEVPRPSICRKCIKERTSSEGSDTEEIQRRKGNHRRRNEKERKLGRKHRGRVRSSPTSQQSSSGLDDIRIIRSARSSSRSPAHRYRSHPSSFDDAGDIQRLPRDTKFEILERNMFVETPPYCTSSRFRMQDSRSDLSYARRLERHNSEHENQNHTEREARIRPRRNSIDHDYNDTHSREYLNGPISQGFSSSRHVQRSTLYQGEREEILDKQSLPYTASRRPLSNHSSERSYDYDPNYDGALPLPRPTRSVRIVKVRILDGANSAKSKWRDDIDYEDRASKAVSTRNALYHGQSRKPILIKSAESRSARRQNLVGNSTDASDENSSPGKGGIAILFDTAYY